MVAAIDRLLPPGAPQARAAPPPATAAAAVEIIAGQICEWGGFPPVPVRRSNETVRDGRAVLPMGFATLTRASLRHAVDLMNAALTGAADRWIDEMKPAMLALHAEADEHLGASRRYIARAAASRGIPCRPIPPGGTRLLIGEGRHGRRLDGTSTWRTNALAMAIAGSKRLSNFALARAGVPVARQRPVDNIGDARRALADLGLPMVLKPDRARRQSGVSFVFRPEDLDDAYALSRTTSDALVAESWIPGREYRALVIEGELASIVENVPAFVTGDGQSTIAALVAAENGGRRRGPRAHGFRFSPIVLNELAIRHLSRQGFGVDHVPAAGATVEVYPLPMMRFGGGLKREVGDRVHPDTGAMLLRAAAVLGLDVAGIDIRTPDIAASWRVVGAGLCEVNAQPSLNVHYNVDGGSGRDVAGILLDRLYPAHERRRLFHVVIVSDADRSEAGRRLAEAIGGSAGWRVALLDARSADLAGYRPTAPIRSWHAAQAMAADDPTLDAAVHLADAATIAGKGLGLTHADLMVIDEAATPPHLRRTLRATARHAGARVATMPASIDSLVLDTLAMIAPRTAGASLI
ncbi:MAG: hypothetical protein AB7O45_04975 [Alphaproteobacteria bacterium]